VADDFANCPGEDDHGHGHGHGHDVALGASRHQRDNAAVVSPARARDSFPAMGAGGEDPIVSFF
jgi:hypothetical protein